MHRQIYLRAGRRPAARIHCARPILRRISARSSACFSSTTSISSPSAGPSGTPELCPETKAAFEYLRALRYELGDPAQVRPGSDLQPRKPRLHSFVSSRVARQVGRQPRGHRDLALRVSPGGARAGHDAFSWELPSPPQSGSAELVHAKSFARGSEALPDGAPGYCRRRAASPPFLTRSRGALSCADLSKMSASRLAVTRFLCARS